MTPAELHRLGSKLRTQVRGDLFEYIDGTLPLILKPKAADKGCAVCAERRKAKTEAQKRWRRKVASDA